MLEASQAERRNMPPGIRSRQKTIGCPNVCVSTPAARRWAVAASPYGPAPTTATAESLTDGDLPRGILRKPVECFRTPQRGTDLEPESRWRRDSWRRRL